MKRIIFGIAVFFLLLAAFVTDAGGITKGFWMRRYHHLETWYYR